MQNQFFGFYRPTEGEFRTLWASCVFVFDTNSLLNLYRYSSSASEDFLRFLETYKERVWIPYQVALEFQVNRLGVISEQVSTFDKVTKLIDDIELKSIRSKFENLQLKKRHSAIEPDDFLDRLDKIAKPLEEIKRNFLKELKELKKNQLKVTDDDPIRNRLNAIFENRVGEKPENQEILDKICEEGELRYAHGIPPGFCEPNKKSKSLDEQPFHIYGGLKYQRQYGDLILWKQLLAKAKDTPAFRRIILITDDSTEDWWWKHDSQGEKIIGPRPELIDEIMTISGVEQFYMYKTDQFLKYANQYVGADIKPETVKQARDISTIVSLDDVRQAAILVEKAVKEWLMETFPDWNIECQRMFPDFIRQHPFEHMRCGYEVKYLTTRTNYHQVIMTAMGRGKVFLNTAIETELEFIFVCADQELIKPVINYIDKVAEGSNSARFTVGILEPDASRALGVKFVVQASR